MDVRADDDDDYDDMMEMFMLVKTLEGYMFCVLVVINGQVWTIPRLGWMAKLGVTK